MKNFRLLLLLTGGLLPAMLNADPAAHIPAAADAALYVHTARLKTHPALKRLANSGELSRFEKPLRELGVSPNAFVAAFFGTDNRVILADVPTRDTVFKALAARYQGNKSYKTESLTIAGRPAVTKTFYLPPRKPYHSMFEAVWFSDTEAAFGDDDYPLPHRKLTPAATGAYRELSVPGTLAAAYIPDPAVFGFDVMGLAKQLRDVRLTVRESSDGVTLAGSAEARDPKTLPQTVQLFNGALRILCVTLFGDSEALCQTLMQKMEVKADGTRLMFGMTLDAATLIAVQNYYDGHAARLLHTLKNNVQKTK